MSKRHKTTRFSLKGKITKHRKRSEDKHQQINKYQHCISPKRLHMCTGAIDSFEINGIYHLAPMYIRNVYFNIWNLYSVFSPQTADIKHFGKVNIKTINLKKRYKVKLKNSGKNKFSLFKSNKTNTINKIGLTVISFIYPFSAACKNLSRKGSKSLFSAATSFSFSMGTQGAPWAVWRHNFSSLPWLYPEVWAGHVWNISLRRHTGARFTNHLSCFPHAAHWGGVSGIWQ